jgi:hypothetical protein
MGCILCVVKNNSPTMPRNNFFTAPVGGRPYEPEVQLHHHPRPGPGPGPTPGLHAAERGGVPSSGYRGRDASLILHVS